MLLTACCHSTDIEISASNVSTEELGAGFATPTGVVEETIQRTSRELPRYGLVLSGVMKK